MKQPLHKLRRSLRGGMALLLVMIAIALATVLGAAILASTSMQTQVKSNTLAASQADYLAESGIQLAIYYLEHPTAASVLDSSGVYPGQNGISFGADFPGTVDIAVTSAGSYTYDIVATAHASNQITRTQTVRAYVKSAYLQTKALSLAGNFTMPSFMTVTGDVRCDGNFTVTLGGTINGSVKANASNFPTFAAPESLPTKAAPILTDIDIYTTTGAPTPYYNYVDASGVLKVGYAELLPALAIGAFTPGPSNPKNVWYADGNVMLSNFTLNGTLVIRGAANRLAILDTAHITATANMPALVVAGPIQFSADITPKTLIVDGLCWTGANIATTTGLDATNCVIQINGALLFGSGASGVNSKYIGTINVTYDSTKVQVPNFSSVGATPQSVKILRWGI